MITTERKVFTTNAEALKANVTLAQKILKNPNQALAEISSTKSSAGKSQVGSA